MSYREKPIIKLYKFIDSAFVLQAIIDDFQEISFERNLYQAGTFTISINYNIPNALLFERGMFVQFGNDPYDFGEIITIRDSIGQDGKGSQIRTITGYDSRYILKRRVIKNMNSNGLWNMTAKGELCLRNLIKDQCGSGAESKRQLPIINTIPASADAIGKEYSVSEQFTNLYEVCKTIATQSEIGWRLAFDGTSLTLECYEGTDRSQTVQFSTSFDSLANGEFSDSSESFSNAIYVGGKGDNEERDIYEGENGTPSGLDRFESFDNQSSMTTESEYEAEALSMLTQYGQTIQMSGNGLAKCPYIYKEQYDVGDLITVAFSGKSAVVQILSVTEHWTWGNYNIQFSFGKPQNNLSEQLQLMLRKIQSASNKEKATESVKWYNVANVNSMNASDVTFNTIGFTGTLTANKTFTFYLDDEKTGAKSYNIYVKNLSGNFTLTLTTERAGKTNYVLKGGVNLTGRILIDDEGNITSQSVTATSVIESGNNQPATSSSVAGAIQNVTDIASSLPTDAVLHYSFDEVPDYPDGTADVRLLDNNTYDIQSTNYQFRNNHGATITNQNGNVQVDTVADTTSSGVYIVHSYTANKIIRFKIRVTELSVGGEIRIHNGLSKVVKFIYEKGVYEITFINDSTATYANFYIFTTNGNTSTFIIDEIYIGDGSYSTPIIDNANGQWNGMNSGSIVVQGVSGKAIKSFKNSYKPIRNTNFKIKPPYSFSLWLKFPSELEQGQNIIDGRDGTIGSDEGLVVNQNRSIEVGPAGGSFVTTDANVVPVNIWSNIVVVTTVEGSGNRYKVYVNGSLKKDSAVTNSNQGFKQLIVNGRVQALQQGQAERELDDLLIFDRALSDTEVLALYQNKANTPKYFPIPTNEIKEGSLELATSGGVFNEINKCQKKFSASVTGNGSYIDITPTENIENYIVNFGYNSTGYANVGIIYFLNNVNGVITVNYKDLVKTQSFVTSPSVELLADGKFRFTHNFGDSSSSLIVKV